MAPCHDHVSFYTAVDDHASFEMILAKFLPGLPEVCHDHGKDAMASISGLRFHDFNFSIEITNVSLMFHQCFSKKSSTNLQWDISRALIFQKLLHCKHQRFLLLVSKSIVMHQCSIDVASLSISIFEQSCFPDAFNVPSTGVGTITFQPKLKH